LLRLLGDGFNGDGDAIARAVKMVYTILMGLEDNPQQSVRQLLTHMLAIVDSSPDALTSRYSDLRDGSYNLSRPGQNRRLPDLGSVGNAFVRETTARRWSEGRVQT